MQTTEQKKRLLGSIRLHYKAFWIFNSVALLLIVGLTVLADRVPAYAEFHARYIYPVLVQTVGRVLGGLPFSVFELLIASVIIGAIVGGGRWIVHLIRQRSQFKKLLYTGFRRVISLLMALLLTFTLTAGINYRRAPFSQFSGLVIREVRVAELKALCLLLQEDLSSLAGEVTRSPAGTSLLTCDPAEAAPAAMEKLGETYPELAGAYPRPKPMFCSIFMSYGKITGIYSPFSIEANYNRLIIPYNIPHTVCHELSHLRGFMREDEANFIAYLACMASDEVEFRYSGTMLAFLYATNALYSAGESDFYRELFAQLPPVVLADYSANNAYWKQFETPIAEVVDRTNDAYLKGNGQEDGVRSYGRVVDLLVAYYIPATE